jgi:hypothetical protein
MSISKFVSGNMTLAGLLAAAAISVAVPAWAATDTTVTWNFYSSPSSTLGTSQTYLGTENPVGSLSAPLSNDLTIKAYGTIIGSYNSGTQSYSSTDLYNKDWTTTSEQGLGLAHGPDNEIGGNGMVQLNISNLLKLLGYANDNAATLSIGSISSSSSDVAVFTASNNLGDLGSTVASPLSYLGGSSVQSQSVTLADLKQQNGHYYQYLNISAQSSSESVLLSTLTLTLPSNSGNPTPAAPAPVPATAGLVLAGALGMGMMMLKRRQRVL